MKKNKSFGISIGASSMLVIIVILALICFAGLSLASSNADYQLCLKLADRTQSYYGAVSRAYEQLALECQKEPSLQEDSISINEAINENQQLCVDALIHPSSTLHYSIQKFKIVTVSEEMPDTSLSLLIK